MIDEEQGLRVESIPIKSILKRRNHRIDSKSEKGSDETLS